MFNKDNYMKFKENLQLQYPFLNIVSNNIWSFTDGNKGIFYVESKKPLSKEEKSSIDIFFSKYDFKCNFNGIEDQEFNRELLDFIFGYIDKFEEFTYSEDSNLTKDEEELQNRFDFFAYEVLRLACFEKKFYSNEQEYFENYTIYLSYKGIKIKVYLLFGFGSFFRVEKLDSEFESDLFLDLESILNEKTTVAQKLNLKSKMDFVNHFCTLSDIYTKNNLNIAMFLNTGILDMNNIFQVSFRDVKDKDLIVQLFKDSVDEIKFIKDDSSLPPFVCTFF